MKSAWQCLRKSLLNYYDVTEYRQVYTTIYSLILFANSRKCCRLLLFFLFSSFVSCILVWLMYPFIYVSCGIHKSCFILGAVRDVLIVLNTFPTSMNATSRQCVYGACLCTIYPVCTQQAMWCHTAMYVGCYCCCLFLSLQTLRRFDLKHCSYSTFMRINRM